MTSDDDINDSDEAQPAESADSPTLNYARPGTEKPVMSLVTIASFGSSWEAHLAVGKLEAAGIPAVLVDENINAVGGGLYTSMSGGIKLQVPQIDADRALEALPARVRVTRVKCPRCGSADTRQIDFTNGLKICFLLMLGIPYLFIKKPWICLSCSNVWRAAPEKSVANHVDDEDDEEERTTTTTMARNLPPGTTNRAALTVRHRPEPQNQASNSEIAVGVVSTASGPALASTYLCPRVGEA